MRDSSVKTTLKVTEIPNNAVFENIIYWFKQKCDTNLLSCKLPAQGSGYISIPGANSDLEWYVIDNYVTCRYWCNGKKHWAMEFRFYWGTLNEYDTVFYNPKMRRRIINAFAKRNLDNHLTVKAQTALLAVLSYTQEHPEHMVPTEYGYTFRNDCSIVLAATDISQIDCVNLILESEKRYDEIEDWVVEHCVGQEFQPSYTEGILDFKSSNAKLYFKHIKDDTYFVKSCREDASISCMYDTVRDTYTDVLCAGDCDESLLPGIVDVLKITLCYISLYRNDVIEVRQVTSRNKTASTATSATGSNVRHMSYGSKYVYVKGPNHIPIHRDIKYQQQVRGYYRRNKNGTRTFVQGFTRYKDKPKRPDDNIIV